MMNDAVWTRAFNRILIEEQKRENELKSIHARGNYSTDELIACDARMAGFRSAVNRILLIVSDETSREFESVVAAHEAQLCAINGRCPE